MVRLLAIGLAALALSVPAGATRLWCTVSPDQAEASLPPVIARLSPLLQSQPHPLAHVHTEGTLPHKGIRDQSIAAEKQLTVMRDAAFAWRAGAGQAYFAMAQRYLDAWVDTYEPDYNPIDETNFDALIDTYAVLAPEMDMRSQIKARNFLSAWAHGYVSLIDQNIRSVATPRPNRWNNNWESHRVKIITMIAVAIDDPILLSNARRLFELQINNNIRSNGEVTDFDERDALHYVIYDLDPLTRAALATSIAGENWFEFRGSAGQSVAGGLAWLAPYAKGERGHIEFAKSTVAFDRERAAAGEQGYSGSFDPSTAANIMWAAGKFNATYSAVAMKLRATPPIYISMCGT